MSTRVPADGARRGGTSKSRAVAGASEIRTTESLSVSTDATAPSAGSGVRSWGHARRAGQKRRHRRADAEWAFHVELPETVPILPAELTALEAHLGSAIDAILAGNS